MMMRADTTLFALSTYHVTVCRCLLMCTHPLCTSSRAGCRCAQAATALAEYPRGVTPSPGVCFSKRPTPKGSRFLEVNCEEVVDQQAGLEVD